MASIDHPLEVFFDLVPTGAALYAPRYDEQGELVDFCFVRLNPAGQRLLGLPAHPTQTFRELYPHSVPTGIFGQYRAAYLTGQATTYDVPYEGDGIDTFFRLVAQRSGDLLVVNFTDLADLPRSAVEQSLRESRAREQAARAEAEAQRQRFHDVLLQLPASIATYRGPDLVYDLVTPGYQQLFRDRRLQGRPIREALPELQGQGIIEQLERVYQTGEAHHALEQETWVDVTDTGHPEQRYYNVSFQALRDAQGRIDGVFNFAYDVTAQVLNRRQLQQLNQELEIQVRQRTSEVLANEAHLAAVFEALPLGVGVMDARGHLTLANGRMQQYLPTGVVPSREATQSSRWRAFHPDGRPLQPEEFPGARALRGEKVVPGTEMLYTQADGSSVWTQVIAVPLANPAGRIAGHVTVILDVDAQKRTEEALRRSEEQFRLFVTTSTDTLYKMSPDWEHMLTLDGRNFLADTTDPTATWLRQYIPPADQALVQHAIAAAIASKGLFHLEHRVFRADGSVGWTLSRAVPVLDAQGQITEWFGAAADITARKQAEEALRQSEARLQRALTIDTVGVLFFDLDGCVHDGNAAFQRMSGYAPTALASGQVSLDTLSTPAFLPATHQALQQLRAVGESIPFEKQYQRPDGSLWWGLSASKRLSETECVKFVLDITKAKEVEQDLRASQQQLEAFNAQLLRLNTDLDTFIYTASHDLKAPITNIEGLIHALQAQLPAPVQHTYDVGPLLGMMQESVARFQRTIEQLSDVIKLQKQHAEPVAEVLLLPVLEDVRRDLRPVLAAAGAQVLLEVGPTARVCFSAKNLRSVVYNLLSNAVKYRHPARAPQVRISCQAQQGYTLLRVQDNGLGIEAGKHADLFQLFRRLHSHVPGTGIGLYMVKRMVDNAGGLIEVESEVGVGSCFTVYFPA
ncbi:PAS domain-containing protein [Hymenobacter sp. HSC-4F20]|uniref:PAS domain-containing sensor histidine kinase n=1 Tax=Hymenobacter sp. HSC-4F20 TaxID=2864135 RepID=UPI001C7380F7|nr:PAS domain-containing sensor histidine kinase [Hymenobacter sp. HSC-4F20]MBX0293092.1 PAS domain-containing protein [Hymenobacter sp. HSC-4F20]